MPIVCTFIIPFKEFYCVGCGRSWGWFSEPHSPRTPEREAEAVRVTAEFGEVARAIVVRGSKLTDCERCQSGMQGEHDKHATDAELAASTAAWAMLAEMQKVRPSPTAADRSE